MFEIIEETYKKEIKDALLARFKKEFKSTEVDDGYSLYEVDIQHLHFRTFMNDEELSLSMDYAFEILEELKNINNYGTSKGKLVELEKIHRETYKPDDEEFSEMMLPVSVYNKFATKDLEMTLIGVANLRRVGGAYWMLLSRPGLVSAIFAVFDRIIDNFDNDELYIQSIYFLFRAILKVRSEEIDKEEYINLKGEKENE